MDAELIPEIKIAVLDGVREHGEREPVELWRTRAGRVVVRAYNECGNNYTEVDLYDLLDWLSAGPREGVLDYGKGVSAFAALSSAKRN